VLHFSYDSITNAAVPRVPQMITERIGRGFELTIGTTVYPCGFGYVADPPIPEMTQVCGGEVPYLAAFRAAERELAETCLEAFHSEAFFADDCATRLMHEANDGSWIAMVCCTRQEYTHPEVVR
jgi:hypothetical protein